MIDPAQFSVPIWITKNEIRNEKSEPIEFRNHLFLFDYLRDQSRNICAKKCAQIGGSVAENLKTFHLTKYRKITSIYCVDEQTEILSNRGWLKYNELLLTDKILTLSSNNSRSRFTKVQEIFKKEVDTNLVSFEARNFSALTTPDHRWIVRRGYGENDELFFDTTENLPLNYYFIPKKATDIIDLPKHKFYEDNLVVLLGWIFTEGCYAKIYSKNGGKRDTRITITQSLKVNPDKCVSIRRTLNALHIDFKECRTTNGCINFYLKGQIPFWVKNKFRDKLPTIEFINSLTKNQIILLIDTIVAGDGWIDQWGTKNIIQKDKRFVDVISYAAVLAGYCPRVNQRRGKDKCWYLKLTVFDYVYTNALKPKDVNYKGIVWCPRTRYGTFYARRNGYCYWTGNTMPSDSDVEEFSKTKTDKIFQSNACIRESLKMDNVFLKQIGDTFLYFKGTRSKAAPISTTADRLVHDEVDRSDLSIINFYASRITDSPHKMTVLLSNPSIKNVGVDLAWKESDKKEWFIKCECGEKQFLTYDENIDEIGKRIVCRVCNKTLTDKERRRGWWEATGPFGAKWSGYHFSHLMYVRHTAEEIIEARETKGIEYFMNFVLGEPYSAGEFTDFRQAIYDVWTPKSLDTPPFFMGVDVGKEKHWALGSANGIFKIGKCESREELESVITRWNPFVVMDSGPERIWAEEFKNKFPKVNLCFYRKDKNISDMASWGGDKGNFEDTKNWGYVWIDRNRVIDACVYDLQRGNIFFSLNREDLEKFILHCETMRRVPEEIEALHTKRYIWSSSTGVNHWFSAMYFWWLAMKRGSGKVELVSEGTEKPKNVVQVTTEGSKFIDLEELMKNEHE